jgi:hypothetical protein
MPANGRRINLIGVKSRGGNAERLGQERLASNYLARKNEARGRIPPPRTCLREL